MSVGHVPLIPANLVALERPPSGPLDGGNKQAAAYGNTHTHMHLYTLSSLGFWRDTLTGVKPSRVRGERISTGVGTRVHSHHCDNL